MGTSHAIARSDLHIGSTASSQRPARHTSPSHQISVADGVVVVQTGGRIDEEFCRGCLDQRRGPWRAVGGVELHAAGIEVRVVEVARELWALGVGINILPHATRELVELGLADELAATGIPTEALISHDRFGSRPPGPPSSGADLW